MIESGETRLYRGLERMSREIEAKLLLDLPRHARVSFSLEVDIDGSSEFLRLQPCPEYSRSRLALPDYHLGGLKFDGDRSCRSSQIRQLGLTLCKVLREHETPSGNLQQWALESSNGEGKPLVPVAISGISYFHSIADNRGVPLAPPELLVYQTNDELSKEFLKRLAR